MARCFPALEIFQIKSFSSQQILQQIQFLKSLPNLKKLAIAMTSMSIKNPEELKWKAICEYVAENIMQIENLTISRSKRPYLCLDDCLPLTKIDHVTKLRVQNYKLTMDGKTSFFLNKLVSNGGSHWRSWSWSMCQLMVVWLLPSSNWKAYDSLAWFLITIHPIFCSWSFIEKLRQRGSHLFG